MAASVNLENDIVIYQSEDGSTQLDVKLGGETVWLNRQQLAELFDRDVKTIGKHIANALKEELDDDNSTVAKFATVQTEGKRLITREVEHYNLDMIISVGYRVKSKRGVEFRRWATNVLKQYLLKGYVVHQNIRKQQIAELRQLVQVVGRTLGQPPLPTTDESRALFDVVIDYTYALDTLDDYDYQRLVIGQITRVEPFRATYENAMQEINALRNRFGGSTLFGNEKDDSFKSSIGQIYQTFGGEELYPSVEEKAAMLLYLVTKNHSFSDGNKRIAATLFLWFMHNNEILYRPDGTKRIADNTLVALTLMIAESKTEEKDVMLKVIVNLINQAN